MTDLVITVEYGDHAARFIKYGIGPEDLRPDAEARADMLRVAGQSFDIVAQKAGVYDRFAETILGPLDRDCWSPEELDEVLSGMAPDLRDRVLAEMKRRDARGEEKP